MKMDKNMKLILATGSNVDFHGQTLYQPTIDDIVKIGEDEFETLLLPFQVSLEVMDLAKEYKDKLKNFDLLFAMSSGGNYILKTQEGESWLNILVDSLKFFFKTDKIRVSTNEMCIKIKSGMIKTILIIDRDNFQELADFILAFTERKRMEKEEVKTFKSEAQKKAYEELQKLRESYKERNNLQDEFCLANIILALENSIDEINKETIGKNTYWRVIKRYRDTMEKDKFNKNMQVAASGNADTESMDLEYWTKKTMI